MTIDLNQATQDELDAIKGLEGHGFEIVRCREDRGRFTTLRELNEVPGLAILRNISTSPEALQAESDIARRETTKRQRFGRRFLPRVIGSGLGGRVHPEGRVTRC
jgi:hypothetical protein